MTSGTTNKDTEGRLVGIPAGDIAYAKPAAKAIAQIASKARILRMGQPW